MRVTEVSKREQVLENIQKTSARLQDAQIQMATGQRINKPSDDPIGTAKMQDIVSTMSAQEQHLRNITDNIASLQHAEKEITHMTELLGRAKTLAISQSGSDANEESRMMVAREFAALRESLFDAGNSRNGKLYLFSGLKSLSPALKKNSMIQPAKVETRGIIQKDIRDLIDIDQYRAVFEGHSNNEYRLRITKGGPWGQARCKISDDGGRTWAKEQVLRPVTAMFNPDGKQDDLVKLKFSDEQGLLGNTIPGYFDFTKEVSEDVEAESLGLVFPDGMEFIGRPNPEISYIGAEDKKEVLISDGLASPVQVTARELLLSEEAEGVDVFSMLSSLERAMLENDGTALALRLKELDQALEQILKRQADIGNTVREFETAMQKIESQKFEQERRLSEIRDSDLAETVIEVKTAEANNRLALDTGSKLIQPTLSDFLR
ncbi:MAG: flagellin [SAR324 cluster bacterium]|nr:flagellin [SAR324 cluster bacterium]